MKKTIALILALVMCLCLLAACGEDSTAASDPGMEAVTAAVDAVCDSDIMQSIPDRYMANTMKVSPDSFTEGYAKISKVGVNINEYGVFKTDDPSALEDILKEYLDYRRDIWMDEYLPEELPKLENAQVWVIGNYVMYAILDDETLASAETAFKGCFEG